MTDLRKMTREEKIEVKEAGIYGYHLARINNLLEEINEKSSVTCNVEDIIEWLLDNVTDEEVIKYCVVV